MTTEPRKDYEAIEAAAAVEERELGSFSPEMLRAADDYLTGQCAWPPVQPIAVLMAGFAEQRVAAERASARAELVAQIRELEQAAVNAIRWIVKAKEAK